MPLYPVCRLDPDRNRRARTTLFRSKTNIAALLRKIQNTTAIDDEAKFGRQCPERFFGSEQSCKLSTDASAIKHFGGIDSGERIDHHVAHGLTVRTVVEQAKSGDHLVQLRQSCSADTADLQIGPPRQIDVAVTEKPCSVGENSQFVEAKCCRLRAYTDDQSVTAQHRPQSARPPALSLYRC